MHVVELPGRVIVLFPLPVIRDLKITHGTISIVSFPPWRSNIGPQDRHIDAALMAQLEAGIARFRPKEIRIQAIMNDAEADQFALEIHGYLKSKGHNVVGDVDWAMFSRPIRGMVMQQTKEGNIALLIGNR